MNETDAVAGLQSQRPSERSRAIEWFISNADQHHQKILTEALESESVPNLRRLLTIGLRRSRHDTNRVETLDDSKREESFAIQILESISSLIRHETEPVIGWLRRSAAQEIGTEYASTETFKNIDLLRQRLAGLEALTAAHRVPRWSRISLSHLISECRPPDLAAHEGPPPDDDGIDTDAGLLSIILGNALQNAQEAAATLVDAPVWVESGVTDRDFWVSIRNRFDGQSFELDEVAHTGASSKASHKGLGVSAMRLAAQRLGYEVSLSAAGGTAFFSLRGRRFND